MTDIYNPKTWRELSYKDKSAYTTANVSFLLGWAIAFVGLFIPPMGEIASSVITVFGIGVSFTAGIYGVAIYVKGSKSEVLNEALKKTQEMLDEHYKEEEEKKDGE